MDDSTFKTVPTRVPAALWESLQTICWAQDNRFLEDAARIINVPAAEIKRRVLGARGVVSAIVSTSGAWFDGEQCPIMIPCGGDMWRRCCEPAECNGHCWVHRKGKGQRYDSDYMKSLPVRECMRLDGEVVWVSGDGTVYDTLGKELKGVRIDLSNGVCYDDRPTPPRWTRAEHDAEAADAEAGSDDE